MTKQRQMYRSRNALVGGVCAGMAEFFNVDPVVIRIFFVAFAFLTLGFGGFLYLALWAVLPKAPKRVRPVDVEPQSVQSDTFGVVDCRSARGKNAANVRYAQIAPYVGAAHLPPEPPSVAQSLGRSDDAVSGETGGVLEGNGASAPESSSAVNQVPADTANACKPSSALICAALLAGSLLVSAGVSVAVSALIRGVAWWQCWPVALVVLGIVRMSVPGGKQVQAATFLLGVLLLSAGLMLLPMSVGVVAWESLETMTERLWPLLVGAVACFAVGLHAYRPVPVLIAALLILAFCVLGLTLYAEPGPLRELAFVTPLGREHDIVLPFTRFR